MVTFLPNSRNISFFRTQNVLPLECYTYSSQKHFFYFNFTMFLTEECFEFQMFKYALRNFDFHAPLVRKFQYWIFLRIGENDFECFTEKNRFLSIFVEKYGEHFADFVA